MNTKKRSSLLAILVAVLMAFAWMPMSAGAVYAEADVDVNPPVVDLNSLEVSISSGNETATVGDTVTFSLEVNDDRGIKKVRINLLKPITGGTVDFDFTYAGDDPETKNGRWQGSYTVTDETQNGLWKTRVIEVFDTSGNSVSYGRDDLTAWNFTVEGTSANPDVTKPAVDLNSLEVSISSGNETATVGDTVTFSFEVNDDRGIKKVRINLLKPITGGTVDFDFTYAGDDPETKNGRWQGSYTVTDETQNGLWKTRVIEVFDTSGNSVSYGRDDLTAWNFTVEGTSANPDVTKPAVDLNSLEVSISSGNETATVGDTVTFSLEVNDDRGIKKVRINLLKPITGGTVDFDFTYVGDDPETKNGRWQGSYTVTDETQNGLWKTRVIEVFDTSGNSVSYGRDDLTAWNFTVTAPDCPLDLTTEGYSMMLDGVGATTTFGGVYYINELGDTVTPTVKVRFDADDGTWTTLAPRKYTLKYEKKTGENTWEEYTESTFGVDADGTATYRVSATGKESLYYTGTVGPTEFNVIKKAKVTFNTNGGSSVEPQYVIPGEKATKPDDPTKEGKHFDEWYSDEDLTNEYWFANPVNGDITIYAGWYSYAAIGIYNKSNPKNYQCGTIDISPDKTDVTTMNYTLAEGDVTFTAKPAEGYTFVGWYEGVIGDSYFVESPSETLISDQNPLTISFDDAECVCAVFECAGHQWEQKVQKATPDADGLIYQQCSICGAENTEAGSTPLPKVSEISLEATSYTYTGEAIEPPVTVANANEALSADAYDVTYSDNINAGDATAKVTLKGAYYEGSKELTFTITQAANPLKITPKTAKVKYSKLKKSAQTLAVTKVMTFTKDAKDKKTYTLSTAKKGKKSFKKYFKINKTTGKVTVKKKLKKGTYKVTVKVQAAGNNNYKKSAVKTVTFTVKVN